MRHPRTELLSEYMDGGLTGGQLREVEEHLEECPHCASIFRDLREVQSRARSLSDRLPQRDLWPGISQRIVPENAGEPEVIRLHPGLEAESKLRHPRGFRVSYLQAAAAVLMVAFSSGLAGAHFAPAGVGSPPGPSPDSPVWVEQVGRADPGLDRTAREVARLERHLETHIGEMDPVTVRLLEKNLQIIDQAIRESIRALEEDPGNPFLESHLARAVETKANYLREATAFVAPAG